MTIKAIEDYYGVKVESGNVLIGQMKSQIRKYEKEYKLSSEQMLVMVHQDPACETEEFSRWIQSYMMLKRITNGTSTAGTHTKTINNSVVIV